MVAAAEIGRSERLAPQDAASLFRHTLLRQGIIGAEELSPLINDVSWPRRSLPRRGAGAEAAVLAAAASHFGASYVDPLASPPDPVLIDRLGAETCLRAGLLPLCQAGAVTVVATARPEAFVDRRPLLEQAFGRVTMALAPLDRIEAALLARRGAGLARQAENRVPAAESCRTWGNPSLPVWALCLGLALLAVFTTDPRGLLQALLLVAMIALVAATALKIAAAVAALRPAPPEPPPVAIAHLPVVSIIIALYREADIAARLVRRLSRLDYPRDLLDVCLAVEAGDRTTREALARAELPGWMRVIVVPAGKVRTKPRALNHALGQCRGSIIGVYDAEDSPDPDQIRRVVERFYNRGPSLACVQGVLDYYNPLTNWLSRCFTLEYAGWFRLILPGIARLGLVVPLGGTTLFFRRAALEELGGWDAHNVTEDADLGLRLFRHGYRTELLATVTREEANCRPWAWVRQRSRWIKGYMLTWLVHMRVPHLLWRQVGARRFVGIQVQFLVSVLQNLLAPVLWLFWFLPSGLTGLPPGLLIAMRVLCLTALAVDLVLGLIALRRSGHRISPLWVPVLQLYFPLATLAAYKALWEMLLRPFYWDKTSHGHFDTIRAG